MLYNSEIGNKIMILQINTKNDIRGKYIIHCKLFVSKKNTDCKNHKFILFFPIHPKHFKINSALIFLIIFIVQNNRMGTYIISIFGK